MSGSNSPEHDMAGDRIRNVICYLRRVAAPADGPSVSDAELLERFVTQRDESAFELVVWRHAAMVLGVCRRVLGHAQDAEDAFQAAFLVLARKAAAVARCRSPGAWLHTVAYRVALRARARRAARTARERPFDDPLSAEDPLGEAAGREVRRVIDEEVSRLPEKYRVPFVLFHLEGRSTAEVARELGRPVGTVESWLTRARERLRVRLARRGLTASPGLLATLAPQPPSLPQAAAAVRAVLAAVQGVTGAVSAEVAALADGAARVLGMGPSKGTLAVMLLGVAVAAATGLATIRHRPAEAPVQPEAPGEVRAAERAAPAEPLRLGTIDSAHISHLTAMALSPDGQTLASAGGPDMKLWNVANFKERATLRAGTDPRIPNNYYAHPGYIDAIAFSPDGKTVASGDRENTVKLWDAATGAEIARRRESRRSVWSVAFRPDGKALALGISFDQPAEVQFPSFKDIPPGFEIKECGQVTVWDLAAGTERTLYRGDTGRAMSVAFSPDGKTLAAGLREGTIRLWDVATGRERRFVGEKGAVSVVAFSPDGQTLASVQGNEIKLWDLASGCVRASLQGHAGPVRDVAFRPDGTLVSAATVHPTALRHYYDADGEVRLWDGATGQPRGGPLTFPHSGSSVALGARGRILTASRHSNPGGGSGEITLWDLDPRRGPAPSMKP